MLPSNAGTCLRPHHRGRARIASASRFSSKRYVGNIERFDVIRNRLALALDTAARLTPR